MLLAVPELVLYWKEIPRSVLVSYAWTTVICVSVEIPAVVVPSIYTIFDPALYEWTVVVPVPEIPLVERVSPVLIPTTESRVIAEVPEPTVANTVLVLVTSPNLKIDSLEVTLVELTVVVVPSTSVSYTHLRAHET